MVYDSQKNTDTTQKKRRWKQVSERTELIKIKWSTPTTHTHNYGLLKTIRVEMDRERVARTK